jgi:membrane protein DedA with SNARE-associated domain
LLAALDSAGVPLPTGVDATIILTAITNPTLAMITAVAALAGSVVGCMFLFYVARKGGELYLNKHASSPRALRFRQWFSHYGLLTVFIPALVPIPLPLKVFVLSAGALGVRPRSFLLTVLAARIPRYFGLAYLGTRLGDNALPWLKQHVLHLTGIAVALFVVLYLAVRWKDQQRERQAAAGTVE